MPAIYVSAFLLLLPSFGPAVAFRAAAACVECLSAAGRIWFALLLGACGALLARAVRFRQHLVAKPFQAAPVLSSSRSSAFPARAVDNADDGLHWEVHQITGIHLHVT
eukprot:COSAG06_NODE_6457_length_2924_cov_9.430442_1_plen_108_part_00